MVSARFQLQCAARRNLKSRAHCASALLPNTQTGQGLHCYYRQPKISRAQFAYLAIYLVLIGNVAAEEVRTERLFRGSDERLYNVQFGKTRLPDSEPAVVIYIES